MPAPFETEHKPILIGESRRVIGRRSALRSSWGQPEAAKAVSAASRRRGEEKGKERREFLQRVIAASRARTEQSVAKSTQAALATAATRMGALGNLFALQSSQAQAPGAAPGSIIDIAREQVGAPYVWAAENPKGPAGGAGAAFDCSGFTKYVMAQVGINLPHMASQQQKVLPRVNRSQLQAGDLVFFNFGRKAAGVADHVGIYIGNGMMVDASSSAGHIVVRPVLWSAFIGGGAVRR